MIKFSLKAVLWAVKYFYWTVLNEKNRITKKFIAWKNYFSDVYKYLSFSKNKTILSPDFLRPKINDKISNHLIDPIYFYQNSWCASKIFTAKPVEHIDVGSKVELFGVISQFVPVTMIDIRPINLKLKNFTFKNGSILNLPFGNGEIKSLSSICVIEHIGLGRYGDELDPDGSEKAAKELTRVLAKNGNLYISVPVDRENRTYFNAHRAFTRDEVLKMFVGLEVVEEKYLYGEKIFSAYDKEKGFGTGMYHFQK